MSYRVAVEDWRDFREDVSDAVKPFGQDQDDRLPEDHLVNELTEELEKAVKGMQRELGDEPSDGSLASAVKALVYAVDGVNGTHSHNARDAGLPILADALSKVLRRVRSADEIEEIDDLELDDWLESSFDSDEAKIVAPALKDVHKRRQRLSSGDDDEA